MSSVVIEFLLLIGFGNQRILSFIDVGPFELITGGTMSIWPFSIGHFIELPNTLVQDHIQTT
jgi:hypothetical protein